MPADAGVTAILVCVPSGWPGAGLLLVRVAVAAGTPFIPIRVLLTIDAVQSLPWLLLAGALIELSASLLVCIGLFSPYAELMLAAASIRMLRFRATGAGDRLVLAQPWPSGLMIGGVTLGLALIGPGADVIAAKLCGRHQMTIPPNCVG